MNLDHIRIKLNEFESAGGIVRSRPAGGAAVANEIQRELSIGFPRELEEFYSTYEYLQIGSDELTWVRSLPAVYERIRLRSPFIPSNYIPIMEDGMGGNYFVAGILANPSGESSQGVYYNPGDTPDRLEPIDASFYRFLVNRIEMQKSLL